MDYVVNLVNMFENDDSPYLNVYRKVGDIIIRRPHSFEKSIVCRFVEKTFREGWADEITPAFSHIPCQCIIATKPDGEIVGFANYDTLRRGMFGPIGVSPDCRQGGVGRALLIEALRGLYNLGFPYGFIGGKNPNASTFYEKCIGDFSSPIPNSEPGVYRYPIKENDKTSNSGSF